MTSRLLVVMVMAAVWSSISAKTITFKNHDVFVDFESTIRRQSEKEESIRDQQNMFVPTFADLRYEQDRMGREYILCNQYQRHYPDRISRKRCFRTSAEYDPMCLLRINFVIGDNEDGEMIISGGCGHEPKETANKCQRKCDLEQESLKWPNANKTTITQKCCCYSQNCNEDYQTILSAYEKKNSTNTPNVAKRDVKHHHHHHHEKN